MRKTLLPVVAATLALCACASIADIHTSHLVASLRAAVPVAGIRPLPGRWSARCRQMAAVSYSTRSPSTSVGIRPFGLSFR